MADRASRKSNQPVEPSDAFLIKSMVGGDEAALRSLMTRYDRLVRYAIHKLSPKWAATDPQWIDSIAVAVWTGFVSSMRKSNGQAPDSVSAFLAQTARNQTISAIRRTDKPADQTISLNSPESNPINETTDSAAEKILSDLEELQVLRESLAELDDNDQLMLAQLSAITDRRWQDAAASLGWSESTLRSRWKQALERLKTAMRGKMGG